MKSVIHMLITLTAIGIISGGILSQISGWAAPKIEAHAKAATEKAIFLVQPDAKSYEKVEDVNFELYKVFNQQNEAIGYSLPYEGNGFQGKIRMMVGIKNDLKELVGIEILEQSETPGLGTKVTEEPFRNQFVKLIADPQVNWVKGALPSNPNEIQAITGATISSKSVVAIINAGLTALKDAGLAGGVE